MAFTVAIVGRPNVGKSTLFNRLVGKRQALVDDRPGVTRDWREGEGHIGPLEFRVIDTAGLEEGGKATIENRMMASTHRALEEADMALFLIDARAGVTTDDEFFSRELRRSGTHVVLVANKCEGAARDLDVGEAWGLGFGEPIPVSAEHGEGLSDLHDAIAAAGGAGASTEEETSEDAPLRVAVLGRPNVGKSTLINRLVGEERMITGPEPGLTRDSVGIECETHGHRLRLYDTAGLRRRSRVQDRVERLTAMDTLRAAQYAETVILMVDANAPLERQDLTIARTVIDEGRALVIAVNKWDLIEDKRQVTEQVRDRLETSLPQVRGIPVVAISALRDEGIGDLFEAMDEVSAAWNKQIATPELNRWLQDAVSSHPPPIARGRRIRLRYITQSKARPPTFIVFAPRGRELPESYGRYLVNSLREAFGLDGTPIRLDYRRTRNPYVDED